MADGAEHDQENETEDRRGADRRARMAFIPRSHQDLREDPRDVFLNAFFGYVKRRMIERPRMNNKDIALSQRLAVMIRSE